LTGVPFLRGAALVVRFVVVAFFLVLAAVDFFAFLAAAFLGAAFFVVSFALLLAAALLAFFATGFFALEVAFFAFFFLGGTGIYLLSWTFGASTRAICLNL